MSGRVGTHRNGNPETKITRDQAFSTFEECFSGRMTDGLVESLHQIYHHS